MKRISFLTGILFLAFASCKKDKEDSSCTLSAASIAGNYKITAVTYKASASTPEANYYDQFFNEDCEKDDILTLNTNNTFIYSDAGVTCSPDGSYDGSWSLSGNTVTVDGDAGTVENFTCNSFLVSASGILSADDKISVTYTRQ